ncbi:MAG: hypothetical protein H6739_00495 [Alphaproteobacteria bacterium]|nr:hypothetical protein [Alphaproteobacteria bacterium]
MRALERFEVIAPGKLLIVGEYAVLDGAPAVVAAVDRGVRCRVSPGDAVETPGDDRFARAALQAVAAPPRRYAFADQNPTGLPQKPGFGGSAAATVAGCAAGLLAAGRGLEGLAETAVAVHHAVQGSGSGVDVRASAHGGIREYAADTAPSVPLALPGAWLAVWSGASAATGPRVVRYQGWTPREDFVTRSAALPELLRASPADALRTAYALLRGMAAAAGLDYDTPALARVATLAASLGGAAKPSGAGGGDVAVAWLPDPDRARALAARCAAEGLSPIPIRIAPGVLTPEPSDAP